MLEIRKVCLDNLSDDASESLIVEVDFFARLHSFFQPQRKEFASVEFLWSFYVKILNDELIGGLLKFHPDELVNR
jgi:hypothetical protein